MSMEKKAKKKDSMQSTIFNLDGNVMIMRKTFGLFLALSLALVN